MINPTVQIQLLDTNAGYLDVLGDTAVPITFSVSDIRDITSRSGTWSKTIQLAGTKNNAKMLNHYFDINVQAGTFDVNKKQRCNIIQNGVVIMSEAYMQLTNIVKVQNNLTEDDEVTYEVVVRNSSAEFFAEITQKELTDLTLPQKLHPYNAANIVSSWGHTVNDVYKYILPWSRDNVYNYKECFPAIYAKVYWDKIHEEAGVAYEWSTLSAPNVRFDKLLIPFNGDVTSILPPASIQAKEIEVEITNLNQTIPSNGFTQHPVFANNFIYKILLGTEIKDPNNEWNLPANQYVPSFAMTPPNRMVYELELDFEYKIDNKESSNARSVIFLNQKSEPSINAPIGVLNITTGQLAAGQVTSTLLEFDSLDNRTEYGGNGVTELKYKYTASTSNFGIILVGQDFAPGVHTLARKKSIYTLEPSAFNAGHILELRLWNNCEEARTSFTLSSSLIVGADVAHYVEIKSAVLKIRESGNYGIALNGTQDLNYYIPAKINQGDFIKSICTMFNLYCESDPSVPNRLIYKRRDDFYDQGRVLDWTYKLARDKEQEIIFIPEELANKKTRFTYRYDQGDPASKAYFDEVNEIYGQMEYTYDNEWVKATDVKEIIFAPTINQPTFWGANLPFFQDTFSPKTGLKILQDGGSVFLPGGNGFVVEEFPYSTTNQTITGSYPFFGHFDRPETPNYDINFGLCDYYSYPITFPTENNLFYLNWARTIQNINEGKIYIADFWLTEADMNLFRLSDRIRIDNGYFYVNKIIDYNAGASQLTRVELITMETPVPFGISTPGELRPYDVKDLKEVIGGIPFDRRPTDVIKVRSDSNFLRGFNSSVVDTNTRGAQILGRGNQLASSFRGMVIGDNIYADTPGVYVGDWKLSESGVEFNGTMFIDGGFDQVMNLNKGNEPDFIDAGENCVRKLGELKSKPFYDGGVR
jgi:hypothetical protein